MRQGELFAGRYRIEREIGRGGMGVVYRATDERMGRPVALKVMRPDDDPAARRRFTREARTTALVSHPNVVTVHDVSPEGFEPPHLTMELLEGGDLARVLSTQGRLDLGYLTRVAGQVAAGLDAAHAKGLVHRDVKPANVLFAGTGRDQTAVVCDFGLAKPLDGSADVTSTGVTVGTVLYMAPEQVKGHPTSPRTDVYALGCVLFHCLTGRAPFPGASAHDIATAHVRDAVPDVRALRPELPGAVADVLSRALAKDPEDRWGSAGELAGALARAADGAAAGPAPHHTVVLPTPPRPEPEPEPYDEPVAASRLLPRGLVPACAVVVAGAAVVGVLLSGSATSTPAPPARPEPAPVALDDAQQALVARLPESLARDCQGLAATDDHVAAVSCQSGTPGADELLVRQWTTPAAMAADWQSTYVRRYTKQVCSAFAGGAAAKGRGHYSSWGERKDPLACYVNDNAHAVVMWEYAADAVQVLAIRKDADSPALLRWFQAARTANLR